MSAVPVCLLSSPELGMQASRTRIEPMSQATVHTVPHSDSSISQVQ